MRIELTPSAWKAEVLPLNYIRVVWVRSIAPNLMVNWSGRRDSNSRPSPWQGDALPLSHFRRYWWRRVVSNHCRLSQRIYSPPPLAARALLHVSNWSWRRESNPQPADYKSAALPLSHASQCGLPKLRIIWRSGSGSNRRPPA